MSTNQFTEDSYEQTLIDLFKRMGYQYECGYDVERDFREPWYVSDLQQSLRKLNPKMNGPHCKYGRCVGKKMLRILGVPLCNLCWMTAYSSLQMQNHLVARSRNTT